MGGLILLFAMGAWIAIAIWLSIWLYRHTKAPRLKAVLKWCAFPVIFLLPLGDEIVGEMQLRYLCSQGAVVHVDEERARGATLTLRPSPKEGFVLPAPIAVRWTTLNIIEYDFNFYTQDDSVPAVQFKEYAASKSFLSGLAGSSRPQLASAYCEKQEENRTSLKVIAKRLNSTIPNWN